MRHFVTGLGALALGVALCCGPEGSAQAATLANGSYQNGYAVNGIRIHNMTVDPRVLLDATRQTRRARDERKQVVRNGVAETRPKAGTIEGIVLPKGK